MLENIRHLWKNKKKIIQGIWNSYFGSDPTNKIAQNRLYICRTECPYYDHDGSWEKAYVKGKEACGICGCNLEFLTHSMESQCSMIEIGKDPLWKAVTVNPENNVNL